jgi:uncharacterized protein YukJ
MFSVNRYITKAKNTRYGQVVDEASSQYYIHIGLSPPKTRKIMYKNSGNNANSVPMLLTKRNLILMRRREMRPLV